MNSASPFDKKRIQSTVDLTYTREADLNYVLTEWENFSNFYRPHGVFNGKTIKKSPEFIASIHPEWPTK